MPFDSQVEIGLPYRYVDQSAVTKVGGLERQEIDGSGHGMGDISVGVAKTLLRENGGWWPDLVARLTWGTGTGESTDGDVLLGSGFNELRGSLDAVKRQDPLAFVGGVSYETTFEDDNVKPGDEFGFSIGTVLAPSPETSLRFGLGQRLHQCCNGRWRGRQRIGSRSRDSDFRRFRGARPRGAARRRRRYRPDRRRAGLCGPGLTTHPLRSSSVLRPALDVILSRAPTARAH